MAVRTDERLGTDRMLPLVFRMALPAVAAQLVNLLYNLVDKIYIGRISDIPEIGSNMLGGVGVTSSVIIFISAFAMLAGGGGSPLVSIALGQGDRDKAEKIMNNAFVMLLFFGVICTVTPYLFMDSLLDFAGATDENIGYAREYLSVYLIGSIFVMIATGMNGFISAMGRPGVAMCSVILGAVLNTALDPVFIFAFDLGVKGAAIATVISQCISALFILITVTGRSAVLRLRLSLLRPDIRIIGRISALGVSPFIMTATESLVGFALNSQLRLWGGNDHVSALAVMQSAMQIMSVPLGGFGQGVIPILGYNYGHGRRDRVISCFKITLGVMFSVNLVGFLAMMLMPEAVCSVFNSSPALVSVVAQYMPVFLAGMTVFGLQRACQNAFVALGQAKISLFIALLRKVLLLIPLAYILPSFLGVLGVYLAEAVADATAALLCALIFALSLPGILKRMPRLILEETESEQGN